ncbi:MAG: glycoside hydrolase family 127 protein [Tepidisphaeraceae bacterium]
MVPFDRVRVDDPVWHPRIATLVRDTLPHAFHNTEEAQESLRLCAEYLEHGSGPAPKPHRFNTSDLFKVMEGAALMIKAEPNPRIEAQMDQIIAVIARSQGKDGYMYFPHQTHNINVDEMGPRPYSFELHSHELYNVGHLYEAAVAYARATGKTALLDVAEKNAQHVNRVFFEGDPAYNDGKPVMQAPGHEEIELGLVKLYQQTGKPLYLQMAKRFVDIRGVTFVPNGQGVNSPEYAQQQLPVAQQREAVGHAVRATYLYAAMAEIDSLTGREDYSAALDSIWHDIIDRKMHLTGGLGAVPGIEGFGPAYELPNKDTYLETCAAVGNVLFNVRMFLKERDAKYLDVAEVALLNNCLAGMGVDGTSFFYPNPLEADAGHQPRSAWFGTACCPSNLARLIPQVPGLLYASDADNLYCALYAQSSTTVPLANTTVTVRESTNYPFDGQIELRLDPQTPASFKLHLRVPTWALGRQFVPGDLYQYVSADADWSVHMNGQPVKIALERGFVVIDRTWSAGDRVTLSLPMPVHANRAVDKVKADRQRVAFTRGPLVLSAESIDNGGLVQRFYVDASAAPQARVDHFADGPLAGLPRFTLAARSIEPKQDDDVSLTLIPYFAWSNRDRGSMITWLPTDRALARPDPANPALAKFARVTASHTFERDSTDALLLPVTPKSSQDTSIGRWTSWPQRGQTQWVELAFAKERPVRAVSLYWYDDHGGVQIPAEWHFEVFDGKAWTPVKLYNTDNYSTLTNTYNTVHPAQALTTDRLRLVMKPKNDQTCVGILSVEVE